MLGLDTPRSYRQDLQPASTNAPSHSRLLNHIQTMNINKHCMTLLLVLLSIGNAHPQEKRTEILVNFPANSTRIDSTYLDNAARLREMASFLRNIRQDSTVNVVGILFCGSASPDGSDQLNHKLAYERLTSLESFIRKQIDIPDSLVSRDEEYIPWECLKSQVSSSDLQHKEEVMAILEEENRTAKLKRLAGGKVWQQMKELFFSPMRNAHAILTTRKREMSPDAKPVTVNPDTFPAEAETAPETVVPKSDTIALTDAIIPETKPWRRHLHLKTNAMAWGMAIANVAAEVDLAEHWSFTLPVYYSAWDYFKATIKFHTLTIQPEFRYWPSAHNDGLFAGAHFGLAYYNFAFNKSYRYQDHGKDTPAVGGGLSIGYRLPVGKSGRWRMEFSIGAGVYSLHYDKFHNTPDTSDGLMAGSVKKTYWGIDQAAVSFAYTFDLKKKGGKP